MCNKFWVYSADCERRILCVGIINWRSCAFCSIPPFVRVCVRVWLFFTKFINVKDIRTSRMCKSMLSKKKHIFNVKCFRFVSSPFMAAVPNISICLFLLSISLNRTNLYERLTMCFIYIMLRLLHIYISHLFIVLPLCLQNIIAILL